jgi:hypothetical protein
MGADLCSFFSPSFLIHFFEGVLRAHPGWSFLVFFKEGKVQSKDSHLLEGSFITLNQFIQEKGSPSLRGFIIAFLPILS